MRFCFTHITITSILFFSFTLPTFPQSESDSNEDPQEITSLLAELVPTDYAEQAELTDPDIKPFNLYAGMDFSSMYISRGLVFSNKFSMQPWIEADVPLIKESLGSSRFSNLSVFAGNWNSLQTGDAGLGQTRTGRGGVLDNWYEADIYGGLRLKFMQDFQTSLRFNWYTSPSDSFKGIQELDWRLTYNDTAFWQEHFGWETFNTSPSLRIAKEIRDSGGPEQWYFQPSITPSFFVSSLPVDFTVKFPLVFGFGADGQYREVGTRREHHFGFFQTGVGFSFPTSFIPEEAGSISISTNFDVIVLSDQDLSFRGEQVEFVSKMGFAYSY